VGASDVFFDYTVTDTLGNTVTATADIKAVNATPGNNALNLSATGVGIYNFSYLDGTNGADTFSGTTANDTLVGAGGGDNLTGGGGSNTYKYNATSDSTAGSGNFDTIADFVHGTDKIDFTGITGLTQVVSATSPPLTIAANTIEFVAAGGNTTIYANATSVEESTASADMEIHLLGVTNMTSSDILHH
jgi:Ca2+-binding RTX toxin-like protein